MTAPMDTREGLEREELEYLEDNIATVAFHLGQPEATLRVYHEKGGLNVDPGEVLKEISRRLGGVAPAAWQPIETAPKDGSHILAYRLPVGIRFTNNTNPPTVVHWFDDHEQPGFYTSVNERAPEYPFNPTHWKPLDAPPSTVSSPHNGKPQS